jgi:hypothetical protein
LADGGVGALEVEGRPILEERGVGDLALGVGLERAGQDDGVLDERLEAVGAQVGGAVGRVAAVDVEADAEAARGGVLDLLDLAVAVDVADGAVARDGGPGVVGTGLFGDVDGGGGTCRRSSGGP